MSIKVFDLKGNESSSIELPPVFRYPYRPEIIKRVFVNIDSHRYQPQGRYPAAGEIVSAESRNTGLGIARLARAKGEGFSRAGQAAGVGGVRKGRLTHPPESWKVTTKKINKKEKLIALYSAISCTSNEELVKQRGHVVDKIKSFPLIVDDEIENINKTRNLLELLGLLGVDNDILRIERSIKKRSGKAKRRGRPNRVGKSALIVVGKNDSPLLQLDNSIPGIGVKYVRDLSVVDFAPGAKPIRLVIFSKSSIDELSKIKVPSYILLE